MNPALACCRPAPTLRPPAELLLSAMELPVFCQPPLPWRSEPDPPKPADNVDPRLRRVGGSIMAAMVEVIAGVRPARQLEDWVEPSLLSLAKRLSSSRDGVGLRLRSVRVQTPTSEAIEVAAHLTLNGRSRAAALRISKRSDQWLATQFTIALLADVISRAGQ